MQVNLERINKDNLKTNNLNKSIYILSFLIIASIILFLSMGISEGNVEYALSKRIPKLIAIILTGGSIAFSTLIFQTITDNRILTPNVMGLDSLYVLIQTSIIFLLGSKSILVTNKVYNFVICVGFMVIASFVLYNVMFKSRKTNILFLILVGMICGTLFSSLSSFMQMVIDPNEFLILQNKLFASFNNVNEDILIVSLIMTIVVIPFIYDDIKYLDVISLGRDHAINLGIDYDKLIKKLFIVISIFISISTVLVGPITFLGILVVNISRALMKTYKHSYQIIMSILVSVFTLVFGQLLIERILNISTPLSVIINLIGGVYFMYLLLKESRI